jgi:enoyl-CoA hydratase
MGIRRAGAGICRPDGRVVRIRGDRRDIPAADRRPRRLPRRHGRALPGAAEARLRRADISAPATTATPPDRRHDPPAKHAHSKQDGRNRHPAPRAFRLTFGIATQSPDPYRWRTMAYDNYEALEIQVRDQIAWVNMKFHTGEPDTLYTQHTEISGLWEVLDRDDEVRVVVLTGPRDEFYLSGAPGAVPADRGDRGDEWRRRFTIPDLMYGEVTRLVHDMIRFDKPIVAAINGPASGAGLCTALLSDISIMASDAWLCDPHMILGISTGDGPGGIWPLHTGIAKAKLYLMTSDAIPAVEADRIGLVSRAVPREELIAVATDYATRLAHAPQTALRFTKRGINQWYRLAELVAQNHATTLEALSFHSNERGTRYFDWPPRIVP